MLQQKKMDPIMRQWVNEDMDNLHILAYNYARMLRRPEFAHYIKSNEFKKTHKQLKLLMSNLERLLKN